MNSAKYDSPMFLWGTQYYRAPTPEPECWEADFARMQTLGFHSVKLWVQWRWSHKRNDRFVFDDLDALMDLSQRHGMSVHLNVIFDVSPHWLFEKYPDALQVMSNGRRVEPFAAAHRQIGGLPGPCYCHLDALAERRKFLSAALSHFKEHPALAAWDVWNEPELNVAQRDPDMGTLACYCDNCRSRFLQWLKDKYGTLDRLNQVWARCYEIWDEVELPRERLTLQDFIDWRLFHTDVMTAEAKWRLDMVREQDPNHLAFLHTVSNTLNCWTLNGADGFRTLIRLACDHADVAPALGAQTEDDADVRVDLISDRDGSPRYVVILNRERKEEEIAFSSVLKLRGLFTGTEIDLQKSSVHAIPKEFADIFQVL